MKWMRITPVVAAGAIAAGTLAVTLDRDAPVKTLDSVRPAAAASEEIGAPSFLPSIATLTMVTRDATTDAIVREYALSGKANANTVTTQGLALSPRSVHPATVLSVYYIPGLSSPDVPVDPSFFDRASVDVNGVTGTLSTPRSGLGAIRVDWVDAAGDYHVVMTERLSTPEGFSGVSSDVLLQVARSIA